MAITQEIKIVADTSQATASVDKLNDSLKDTQTEAKKADKSIDDVSSNGGAIAILDQLTGGLATRFKDAYEASKLFNVSLKATKGALIATGIGAFAVVLGTVVAYWDEIVEFITGANARLQEQINLNREIQESLNHDLKLLSAKEKLLIAEGKSTEEIKIQKEKILLIQLEQNQLLVDNLKTQLEREKAQVREITLWERTKIAISSAYGATALASAEIKEAIEGSAEERKALQDLQNQITDALTRSEELKLSLIEINQKGAGAGGKKTKIDTTRESAQKQREIDLEERLKTLQAIEDLENEFLLTQKSKEEQEEIKAREKYFTAIERARQLGEETIILEEALQSELNEIRARYAKENADRIDAQFRKDLANAKKLAEQEEKIEEATANAKVSIRNQTSQLIQEIAGKDSIVGKGVAVASATISGIEGVQNAYTTAQKSPITLGFPAYPVIQAGLAGAFSALQIGKILSTDPTGKSAGASSSSVGGGGTAPAPSFNLVQGSGTNQIAESLNSAGNRPIQAYVVSSAVTSGQELDRNILDSSTI